jgi:large subunit ribosomal protein L13
MFKTYSITQGEIQRKWLLIDARNLVIGRLASVIATILRGKHKAEFTPHMDCGDNIVVINAKHAKLTGNKENHKDGKTYYWHTGYPGGIKQVTAGQLLKGAKPELVLKKAVQRMISRNKLGRQQMTHLYLYPEAEHKHEAQQPEVLDVAALNRKNSRIKG